MIFCICFGFFECLDLFGCFFCFWILEFFECFELFGIFLQTNCFWNELFMSCLYANNSQQFSTPFPQHSRNSHRYCKQKGPGPPPWVFMNAMIASCIKWSWAAAALAARTTASTFSSMLENKMRHQVWSTYDSKPHHWKPWRIYGNPWYCRADFVASPWQSQFST